MAIINLETDRINSLNTEISSLNTTLKDNYFPAINDELNNISNNIQGDEINVVLNTIKNEFQEISTTLAQELPRLENFLNEQIGGYNKTENELTEELMNLLNVITEHIYTVSYIGPAGILNVANSKSPKEMVEVVEKFLRPESVAEKKMYGTTLTNQNCEASNSTNSKSIYNNIFSTNVNKNNVFSSNNVNSNGTNISNSINNSSKVPYKDYTFEEAQRIAELRKQSNLNN